LTGGIVPLVEQVVDQGRELSGFLKFLTRQCAVELGAEAA
jgi:hypothetical protein